MEKGLSSIIFLFLCVGLKAQEKDDCIRKFYAPDNALLLQYTISDTVEIKRETDLFYIRQVIKDFSSQEITTSVKALKTDSTLNRFHSRFVHTEAVDGINLKDCVEITETTFDKRFFFKHTKRLNRLADSLMSYSGIINISVFYFNPALDGELYLYERGARMAGIFEFRLNRIYNSPLMSPIFPYEEVSLSGTPYRVGIEQRTHTRMMIIPIVQEGDVSFNVQLIICDPLILPDKMPPDTIRN